LDVLRGGFGDDAAEHQARDTVGVAYPELQRGLGAVAVAHHDRAVQPERLHERRAVVGHEVVAEPPFRVVGAAVTAGVGHQHAVVAGERGDVVGPHEVTGDQSAVEQDDRRACPMVLVLH
jgi:hypothetical protein